MDGIFVHDFLTDRPWRHPLGYALSYYKQYPALGFIFWPPFFAVVEGLFFLVGGVSVTTARVCVAAFAVLMALSAYAASRVTQARLFALAAALLIVWNPTLRDLARGVMLEVPVLAMALLTVGLYSPRPPSTNADTGRHGARCALGSGNGVHEATHRLSAGGAGRGYRVESAWLASRTADLDRRGSSGGRDSAAGHLHRDNREYRAEDRVRRRQGGLVRRAAAESLVDRRLALLHPAPAASARSGGAPARGGGVRLRPCPAALPPGERDLVRVDRDLVGDVQRDSAQAAAICRPVDPRLDHAGDRDGVRAGRTIAMDACGDVPPSSRHPSSLARSAWRRQAREVFEEWIRWPAASPRRPPEATSSTSAASGRRWSHPSGCWTPIGGRTCFRGTTSWRWCRPSARSRSAFRVAFIVVEPANPNLPPGLLTQLTAHPQLQLAHTGTLERPGGDVRMLAFRYSGPRAAVMREVPLRSTIIDTNNFEPPD